MSENLVIVESPAKSKTIEKYLGQNLEHNDKSKNKNYKKEDE